MRVESTDVLISEKLQLSIYLKMITKILDILFCYVIYMLIVEDGMKLQELEK